LRIYRYFRRCFSLLCRCLRRCYFAALFDRNGFVSKAYVKKSAFQKKSRGPPATARLERGMPDPDSLQKQVEQAGASAPRRSVME
jgi:hypothetical protein